MSYISRKRALAIDFPARSLVSASISAASLTCAAPPPLRIAGSDATAPPPSLPPVGAASALAPAAAAGKVVPGRLQERGPSSPSLSGDAAVALAAVTGAAMGHGAGARSIP